MFTFGTVCDGIGCGHLAFERAGFACSWSFEIDAFPSAVLAHRFPDVLNYGDMNLTSSMVLSKQIEAPDVFIGGTPCQAFSVAGKRKGLEDERGNLSLTFCRIADSIDDVRRGDGKPPVWVLWENVPGVLSDKGNAFGCFLGELSGAGCVLQPPGGRWANAGCVFGPKRTVAWRICDSQFFGVAQRRRRVFVVAGSGDFRPEQVLFEREGVRRDSAPIREAWEGTACDVKSGIDVGHWDGGDCHPSLCAGTKGTGGIAASNQELFSQRGSGLVPSLREQSQSSHRADGECFVPVVENGCFWDGGQVCQTLDAVLQKGQTMPEKNRFPSVLVPSGSKSNSPATCHCASAVTSPSAKSAETTLQTARVSGQHKTELNTKRLAECSTQVMQVRRLTPRECERLQGLPDNWTQIPWRGRPAEECPDGPRYKGIGNGQTVQVMEWLARRIMACF